MKYKALFIFLIIFSIFSSAVEISDVHNPEQAQDLTAKILQVQQDVKQIKTQISNLPSKDVLDSSFAQLDVKVESTNQSNILNFLAFLVGALIFNDIIVIGLYLIFKSKGLLI